MKFDVYYVDAFTDEIFAGNPAAVIFTDINDDRLMQKIASENNLSETAFVNISKNKNYIMINYKLCANTICSIKENIYI